MLFGYAPDPLVGGQAVDEQYRFAVGLTRTVTKQLKVDTVTGCCLVSFNVHGDYCTYTPRSGQYRVFVR